MRVIATFKCAAICLALVGVVSAAQGAVLVDLYNTGLDADGVTLLANGVTDSHYSVVRVSPAVEIKKNITVDGIWPVEPIGPWFANNGISRWLGVAIGDSDTLDTNPDPTVNGLYEWTTTFTVPLDADLATLSITGLWGSDNPGLDILLNGGGTGNTSSGYTSPDAFSIISGVNGVFLPGPNTLTFIVLNLAQVGGNPTGLRVDSMVGTYDAIPPIGAVPEASSFLVVGLGGIFAFGAIGLGKRYGFSAKL